MNFLVDSTIYIHWMRSGHNPIRMLAPWLRAGTLAGCGIVRAEVLRGIVTPSARREMALLFAHMPDVPLTTEAWDEVAELAWELDRTGVVLPLTDIAVSVCARHARATVVTHDKHFRKVPGLSVVTDLPRPTPS